MDSPTVQPSIYLPRKESAKGGRWESTEGAEGRGVVWGNGVAMPLLGIRRAEVVPMMRGQQAPRRVMFSGTIGASWIWVSRLPWV